MIIDIKSFPEIYMVFPLYCYLLRHLVKLVCDLVIITGRRLEEAVISVVQCGIEAVSDRLDYSEATYIQLSLRFGFEPPRGFANRHIFL